MDPQPSPARPDRPPLVLVGASCRAAAASATAAGWAVHAADLFDDLDLREVAASTRRIADHPAGIAPALAAFPAAAWCYTGPLENHPGLIDLLAASRPLAGNASAAIRVVREPRSLAALLGAAGLRFPDTFTDADRVATDGSFLRKPLAGAGGRAIVPWTAAVGPAAEAAVWQRRVAGTPLSAVFALAGDNGRLLGLSLQIVGAPWCRAAAFAYCGSVGMSAAALPAAARDDLETLAATLAAGAGLAGVVGADLILEADGRITVIEVNPRPTASAELAERSTGESFMAAHLAAFGLRAAAPPVGPAGGAAVWSKAILFTGGEVAIDDRVRDRLRSLTGPWTADDGLAAIADIPVPGQTVGAGRPLLTLFSRGGTAADALATLRSRVAAVQAVVE